MVEPAESSLTEFLRFLMSFETRCDQDCYNKIQKEDLSRMLVD